MKKQKPQKIESHLHTKSFAQLEDEIRNILNSDLEDKNIAEFINDGQEFAGWSPAHTINNIPYEELVKKKKQIEDENS